MKKTVTSVMIASMILSGCDVESNETSAQYPPEIKEYMDEEAKIVAQVQMKNDDETLRQVLDEAKKTDPNIKSGQYELDENGNPVIRVIRNGDDGEQESVVLPVVTGIATGLVAGYLLNSIMNTPKSSYHKDRCDDKCNNHRAGGVAAYHLMKASNLVSQPNYTPRYSQNLMNAHSNISTRSSGVFTGSSGRSSSSSFGG
jgi:DNA-directed RNA polymerase subunit L